MDEKISKKEILIMLVILATVFFLVYAVITFFGVGLLSFLGFEYDSIKSVLLFFLAYFLISIPFDTIATICINSIKELKKATKFQYEILYFIKDMVVTIAIISMLDYFFTSIEIPFLTTVLFALLSYLLEKLSPVSVKKSKFKKKQ